MPDQEREAPTDPSRIYEGRGDVPLSRPIMQGDIFVGSAWAVDESPPMSMVIQHPCTIRKGAGLREHLTVVAVRPRQALRHQDWQGFGHLMPLPDLQESAYYAADFCETTSLRSETLNREDRVAALSNYGICVLHQRLTHYMTRFTIDVATLAETFEGIAAEMELLYEWVDAALDAADGEAPSKVSPAKRSCSMRTWRTMIGSGVAS